MYPLPYVLVLVAQGVCILHALKTNRDFRWFWLIMFLPGIGCAIYFWLNILPGLRGGSLPELDLPLFQRLRISAAEKQLRLCDSLDNRVELAELYARAGRVKEALALIADSVSGVHRDSPYLLYSYALILFRNGEHRQALATLDRLEAVSDSVRRRERKLLRGRVLAALGEPAAADLLRDACKGFDGEEARYWYAHHLQAAGRHAEAIAVCDQGIADFRDGEALYRRHERPWYRGMKAVRAAAAKAAKAAQAEKAKSGAAA